MTEPTADPDGPMTPALRRAIREALFLDGRGCDVVGDPVWGVVHLVFADLHLRLTPMEAQHLAHRLAQAIEACTPDEGAV